MALYNNKLYLWGGRNKSFSVDGRLHIYDFATQVWTSLATKNTPELRDLYGLVVYEDYLYCLPGWGTHGYDERSIKRINLKSGSSLWETMDVDAVSELDSKFPRDSYGYVIKGSLVYITCGWNVNGNLNDIVKLDLSRTPLKYEKVSSMSLNPSRRINHTLHTIGTKLYLFGGVGEAGK